MAKPHLPPEIPGNHMNPELILNWLVKKRWFWRNELGIYGPFEPPKRRSDLESYTKAITMLAVSPLVARSGGRYEGEVRFSIIRQIVTTPLPL